MKAIGKKDSYERKASVEGSFVRFQHLTLHAASNTHYLLNTTFNFTDVPTSVLLRLAGENRLIAWRTAFKNADKVDDTADNQTVDVAKWLSKARAPRMSAGEAIVNLAGKLTKEQLAKAIAELTAMTGAEEDEIEVAVGG